MVDFIEEIDESFEQPNEFNVWPAFIDIILLFLVMVVLAGSFLVIDAFRYKEIEDKKIFFRQNFVKQFDANAEVDDLCLCNAGEEICLCESESRPNEQIITFGGDLLFETLDHQLSLKGQEALQDLKSVFDLTEEVLIKEGEIMGYESNPLAYLFSEIQVLGHTDNDPIDKLEWSDLERKINNLEKKEIYQFYRDRKGFKETHRTFNLTEGDFTNLRSWDVPASVLESLEPLKGKDYKEEQEFLYDIEEQIGLVQSLRYSDIILRYAANNYTWKLLQKTQFETNWELSAGRALSVLRFLTDSLRIDPTAITLSATGCSQYQPRRHKDRDEWSDVKQWAWDRRIEVRLIYGLTKE